MASHDYVIDNQSGLNFRADLNNALQAIVTQNSGSSEPTATFAYMFWVDTSGANPILKQRNGANSGWVTVGRADLANLGIGPTTVGTGAPSSPSAGQFWIDTSGANPILNIRDATNASWIVLGRVDIPNLGLLPLTGGALSGAISFSNTDHIRLPVGSTGQRTGSPLQGMIRYNSDLVQFEGYSGGAWSPVGGGGYSIATLQSVASSGTITTTTTDQRQLIRVQGSGGAVTVSNTPFGSGGGWRDGTEVLLVGNDDTNTLSIPYNDAAKGAVGNFSTLELLKYTCIQFIYVSALDRWLVTGAY